MKKEQLTFNYGNHLTPDDIRFTKEEESRISDAAESLVKSATSKLSASSRKSLLRSWKDSSTSELRAAEGLCAFCPKNISEDTFGYSTVKEAVTKSKVMEKAASLLEESISSSETHVSLDRLPGETEQEHKARLRAYLSE